MLYYTDRERMANDNNNNCTVILNVDISMQTDSVRKAQWK